MQAHGIGGTCGSAAAAQLPQVHGFPLKAQDFCCGPRSGAVGARGTGGPCGSTPAAPAGAQVPSQKTSAVGPARVRRTRTAAAAAAVPQQQLCSRKRALPTEGLCCGAPLGCSASSRQRQRLRLPAGSSAPASARCLATCLALGLPRRCALGLAGSHTLLSASPLVANSEALRFGARLRVPGHAAGTGGGRWAPAQTRRAPQRTGLAASSRASTQ